MESEWEVGSVVIGRFLLPPLRLPLETEDQVFAWMASLKVSVRLHSSDLHEMALPPRLTLDDTIAASSLLLLHLLHFQGSLSYYLTSRVSLRHCY